MCIVGSKVGRNQASIVSRSASIPYTSKQVSNVGSIRYPIRKVGSIRGIEKISTRGNVEIKPQHNPQTRIRQRGCKVRECIESEKVTIETCMGSNDGNDIASVVYGKVKIYAGNATDMYAWEAIPIEKHEKVPRIHKEMCKPGNGGYRCGGINEAAIVNARNVIGSIGICHGFCAFG